jgi:hydrogenase maturation factor
MLAALQPSQARAAVAALVDAGYEQTAVIGEVMVADKTSGPSIQVDV